MAKTFEERFRDYIELREIDPENPLGLKKLTERIVFDSAPPSFTVLKNFFNAAIREKRDLLPHFIQKDAPKQVEENSMLSYLLDVIVHELCNTLFFRERLGNLPRDDASAPGGEGFLRSVEVSNLKHLEEMVEKFRPLVPGKRESQGVLEAAFEKLNLMLSIEKLREDARTKQMFPKDDRRPILALDFDGVLHWYREGWKGAAEIYDEPVPGAVDFVQRAVEHFRIMVFSSRSRQEGGIEAMQAWMEKHGFPEVDFPEEKPPAHMTIDDRAIQFRGEWPEIEDLLTFQPWNKLPGV